MEPHFELFICFLCCPFYDINNVLQFNWKLGQKTLKEISVIPVIKDLPFLACKWGSLLSAYLFDLCLKHVYI